jgi:hypothetical protein
LSCRALYEKKGMEGGISGSLIVVRSCRNE